MDHGIDIERRVREDLLKLGKDLGMRPVITNDCHYVTQDQAKAHEAMLCVQTGKTLSDPSRFKFDGDGYYLIPPEEIRARWDLSLIHISEPTRPCGTSRMPSSA